jgi:HSP20 family protein
LTSPAKDLAERARLTVERALDTLPRLAAVDWFPSIAVLETRNEFVVTAEIPGVSTTNVELVFADGILTLRGQKEEAAERNVVRRYLAERQSGAFERTVPLGKGIVGDAIKADLVDGILTVHLPKTDEAKSRTLRVAIRG